MSTTESDSSVIPVDGRAQFLQMKACIKTTWTNHRLWLNELIFTHLQKKTNYEQELVLYILYFIAFIGKLVDYVLRMKKIQTNII